MAASSVSSSVSRVGAKSDTLLVFFLLQERVEILATALPDVGLRELSVQTILARGKSAFTWAMVSRARE